MTRKVFDRTFITFLAVGVVNTLFGTAIMFVLYNVFDCSYWVSSSGCRRFVTTSLAAYLAIFLTSISLSIIRGQTGAAS